MFTSRTYVYIMLSFMLTIVYITNSKFIPPVDCDIVVRLKEMDTLSLSTYLLDEGFPLKYCEGK